MKENPYSKFLDMVKPDKVSGGSIVIGQVISTSPFTVSVGELQLDADNLLVSDHLLEGYQRSYSSDRLIPNGSAVGNITYTDGLNAGDRLAMIPTSDKQLYIALARVRGL